MMMLMGRWRMSEDDYRDDGDIVLYRISIVVLGNEVQGEVDIDNAEGNLIKFY